MAIRVLRRSANVQLRRAEEEGATILDVTSHGPEPWIRFSPFYPHGRIPLPLSPGYFSASVEGAWQGLKVFEKAGVDLSKLNIRNMKNLKRTTKKYGRMLGHRVGIGSQSQALLPYITARKQIYLPLYKWVLDNRLAGLTAQLRTLSAQGEVVLLDYTTNGDVDDTSSPLSHAQLIRRYVEGDWPVS